MAVCSMLCMDGLLLHLVGKRQLLVYLGASYGNGKLGDSIWEGHDKSSAQGARRARAGRTFPLCHSLELNDSVVLPSCSLEPEHLGCPQLDVGLNQK